MIQEAIEKICALQLRSQRLKRLDIHDERNAYFDCAGTIVTQPIPPAARDHQVFTLDSFAEAVKRYAKDATVWCVLDKVACVLNDKDGEHRIDRVSMPVTPSGCFKVLSGMDWMDQQSLVDVLRHKLAEADLSPAETLPILRNLKFATQTEQYGQIANSAAKMGKSVASQVTGDSDLPETVSVQFHPFPSLADEIDTEVVVWCTLFTNPAMGKLKLEPRQGELENARNKAMHALLSAVGEKLEEGVPVFAGVPGR